MLEKQMEQLSLIIYIFIDFQWSLHVLTNQNCCWYIMSVKQFGYEFGSKLFTRVINKASWVDLIV